MAFKARCKSGTEHRIWRTKGHTDWPKGRCTLTDQSGGVHWLTKGEACSDWPNGRQALTNGETSTVWPKGRWAQTDQTGGEHRMTKEKWALADQRRGLHGMTKGEVCTDWPKGRCILTDQRRGGYWLTKGEVSTVTRKGFFYISTNFVRKTKGYAPSQSDLELPLWIQMYWCQTRENRWTKHWQKHLKDNRDRTNATKQKKTYWVIFTSLQTMTKTTNCEH